MNTLIFIVVLVVSFILGTFGFAQIIGSLQNMSSRPNLLFTMILWIAILIGGYFIARAITPNSLTALFIGYIASFVIVLLQGRVQ